MDGPEHDDQGRHVRALKMYSWKHRPELVLSFDLDAMIREVPEERATTKDNEVNTVPGGRGTSPRQDGYAIEFRANYNNTGGSPWYEVTILSNLARFRDLGHLSLQAVSISNLTHTALDLFDVLSVFI